MIVRRVGAELFQAEGRTDMPQLIAALRNCANAPRNVPPSTVSFYSTRDISTLYGAKGKCWPRSPSHFLCLRNPFMSLDWGSARRKACTFLHKTTWMHIKRRERGHLEDLGVW